MHHSIRPALIVYLLLLIVFAVLSPSNSPSVEASASGIVISQVYAAGGTAGSVYTHDFIELFNAGSSPVSLNGWSIQYAVNSDFNTATEGLVTFLPDFVLQVGQYYLVQGATTGAGTTPLSDPDVVDDTPIGVSATKAKIALANNGESVVDTASSNLVDLLGYGGANLFEGANALAPNTSATVALKRKNDCTDTNNNLADFEVVIATPRNSQTPFNPCVAIATATPTSEAPAATATSEPATSTPEPATSTPEPPAETATPDLSTATGTAVSSETPAASATETALASTAASTTSSTSEPTQTGTGAAPTATSNSGTPDSSTPTATPDAAILTPTPSGSTSTPNTPDPTSTSNFGIELLVNGDMEASSNGDKLPDHWEVKNQTKDRHKCNKPDKIIAHTGICVFQFKGGILEKSKLVQDIALDSRTFNNGDVLTLSLVINAPGTTARGKVKLIVKYSDSTEQDKFMQDFASTSQYSNFGGALTLESGNVEKILVQIDHRSPSGKVHIDTASLIWMASAPLLPLP